MQVWIDLEETIITSWAEGLLINERVIKKWLDDHNIGPIHIWSFAIWDEKDQADFIDSGMRACLERILGRGILSHICVREVRAILYEDEGVHYSNNNHFIKINGKHWSFLKYCLSQHPNEHCVLIDDSVPSLEVNNPRTGGQITLININDLIRPDSTVS